MKKLLFAGLLALLAKGALAQGTAPGASGPPSPDCYFSGVFSNLVTSATAVTQSTFNNLGTGCTIFHLVYSATSNVSALSIELDGSVQGATPQSSTTFGALGGLASGTSNPDLATAAGEIASAMGAPPAYLQVKLNSVTVSSNTGTISYIMMGYRPGVATTPNAGFGSLIVNNDPCSQVFPRSATVLNLTASTQIATGTAGKQTYVCYIQFSLSATADNVALVEGTGSTCGSNTAGMSGGATAATGWNLLANGSVTSGGFTHGWAFKTATAGDNVCLLVSSASQVSGIFQYVQQ